jgi:hypothetical protein
MAAIPSVDKSALESVQEILTMANNGPMVQELAEKFPTMGQLLKDVPKQLIITLARTGAIKFANGTLKFEFSEKDCGDSRNSVAAWDKVRDGMKELMWTKASDDKQPKHEPMAKSIADDVVEQWRKRSPEWPPIEEGPRKSEYPTDQKSSQKFPDKIFLWHVWAQVTGIEQSFKVGKLKKYKVDITATMKYRFLELDLAKLQAVETLLGREQFAVGLNPYEELVKKLKEETTRCLEAGEVHFHGVDIFKIR